MDDHASDRKSSRKQLLRYLLRPPLLFAIGYVLAKIVAALLNQPTVEWFDPMTWGCGIALASLVSAFSYYPRSHVLHAVGPKPPGTRKLALILAVSTVFYAIIFFELGLFWNRASLAESIPDWAIILLAILLPFGFAFGGLRYYRTYKEPTSD